MGKKGKEKKKPGKGREKTERKTAKAEEKRGRREDKMDNKGGADDIDAILEKIRKEAAKKLEVLVEEDCPAPSVRCNCSVTVNPLKETELILYGGEYYNGDKTYVYGDLYRYNTEKGDWKHVSSPNSPPPRSAHQAVAWKGHVFIFGGEFTSPNQERFHHYKDLWRFDIQSNTWEQVQLKGGPSPRSGHRMILWKHKLIVFGGFYDTLREVRYFNDLYVLDLDDYKWQEIKPKPGAAWPSARSAFQLAVNGDEVFLYGGYFKDHAKDKDGSDRGIVHCDMWSLDPKSWEWNKVKRIGKPPSARAGFSIAVHKKRVIFFGGVVDSEEQEVIRSTFLNEMWAFQMDNRRWYPFQLRRPKQSKSKQKKSSHLKESGEDVQEESVEHERKNYDNGSDNEEDKIWEQYEEEEMGDDEDGETEEESSVDDTRGIEEDDVILEETTKDDLAKGERDAKKQGEGEEVGEKLSAMDLVENDLARNMEEKGGKDGKKKVKAIEEEVEDEEGPCGRINASMVVSGNTLFLYGGMMEIGDQEVTLDDLYALDLNKLDKWRCLIEASHSEWVEVEDDDDDDEEDEEEEEEEESGEENDEVVDSEEEEPPPGPSIAEAAAAVLRGEGKRMNRKERKVEIDRIRAELGLSDMERTPQPGETLRDFFARTSMHWQKAAYERTQNTGKELRKDGFDLCELRYKELRPVLDELERLEVEQKEEEVEEAKQKGKEKAKRPAGRR